MDGSMFVLLVEAELQKRGVPKSTFYKDTGISSATFSQWRKNIYSPSSAAIRKVEEYLGITFTLTHGAKKETPTEISLDERLPGYDDLSEENKLRAREYVELLLKSQQI